MAKYVFLLRDSGSLDGMSPEEMQKVLLRYRDWADKVQGRGKLSGGQKLRNGEGRVLKRSGSKLSVTDGPFTEAKEILGGFFVVDANSYDEALSIANDCPHLDFGSIEVREVEVMRG
jgi:hypothetical protein